MKIPCLYRHFSEEGELLYVGVSLTVPARTHAHSNLSSWFDDVVRIEIERFETIKDAWEAETEAIRNERPKYNKTENNSNGGRPRIEARANTLTARKPWVAAGMSRATWYTRQKEKRL